ncbi:ABC transporter substrate-binding protein [Streptomyces sp. NPDC002787]
MRLNRLARTGAVVLSLALVGVGCSSNRSGEGPATEGGKSTEKAATFGDMESPCGPGDAKGATDQGVTDTSIAIGYGDDRGYTAAPGLSQEVGDAVKAMIKWCNDQGGINGRKLAGTRYDAAVTNTVPVMKKACKQEFMLVGDGLANDFAGDPVRVACKLPHVPAFTVGPNATMGRLKFEPMPYPVDLYNAAGLKAELELIPELKESISIMRSDAPATQVSEYRVQAALAQLGVQAKDCGVVLHMAGDASYAPLAQKLKGCGAKSFFTAYSPSPQVFGFLQAVQEAGVKLPAIVESQWYGQASAEWNAQSHAAEGFVTSLSFQPLENADIVPAVKQYKEIVAADGGKVSLTGLSAASAFLLWATVAKKCGSDLTRQCMVDGLGKVHDWTAGGLQAPSDPGANKPSECALLMKLEGGAWKQIHPAKRGEFDCDPSNVLPMDPKISGINIDGKRQFVSFLKKP